MNTTGPIKPIGAPLDQRPLSLRTQPAPARVEAALRRRIVLRARVAIDYPTTLDPADIRHWLAEAIASEVLGLGGTPDLIQIAYACDPVWRAEGPPDLTGGLDSLRPDGADR